MKNKKDIIYQVKSCGQLNASVKDVDTSGRIVTGFYNTFNFLDSDQDVMLVGAAKKSITERGPSSTATAKIKHALFHDLTQLPAKIMVLKEAKVDGIHGIYFESKMADTTLGNDTLQNYLEGIYDNHSIGFQYKQIEGFEKGSDGFNALLDLLVNPEEAVGKEFMWAVKEIMLFEGSTVSFGANSLTPFLGVKSGNKDSYLISLHSKVDKLSRALKNGSQSDDSMQIFEIQVLQMKQLITEIIQQIPEPIKKDVVPNLDLTPNYSNIAKNFTL